MNEANKNIENVERQNREFETSLRSITNNGKQRLSIMIKVTIPDPQSIAIRLNLSFVAS